MFIQYDEFYVKVRGNLLSQVSPKYPLLQMHSPVAALQKLFFVPSKLHLLQTSFSFTSSVNLKVCV